MFGVFCTLGSAFAVEFVATEGPDFVVIDCQHGLAGQTEMAASLQALAGYPVVPFVRVPAGDDAAIERALDAGAFGVIVPGVESGQRARDVAARCAYPPSGVRSFGPVRSELVMGLKPSSVNERVLCIVMIESRAGLEAREEICSVQGVSGVYVGPADLAISLGLDPTVDVAPGLHADAVASILTCAQNHGLITGIHAGTGAQASARSDEGFSLVTISGDASLLRWAVRKSLKDARAPRK